MAAALEETTRPFKVAVNKLVINKSDAWEVLATRFENTELTQEQLAYDINQGYAFTTHHTGRRQQDNFTAAEYVALDFDKASTEELNAIMSDPIVKNYYSIFYYTPSSTTEQPKFRLIFQLNTTIKNKENYRKLVAAFIWRFSATVDKACSDPTRLFYGSKGSNPVVTGHTIPNEEVKRILAEYDRDQAYEEELRATARKVSGKLTHNISDQSKTTIFEKTLDSHCARVKNAAPGDRHYTLMRSARALGGYIAGEPGIVNELEVRRRLEDAYSSHSGYNRKEMRDTINYGLRVGQHDPIEIKSLTQPAPVPNPEKKKEPDAKTVDFGSVETMSGENLLKLDLADTEWVIPDLIPEGVTLLAGRPKLGKSFFILEMALAVTSGRKFMDYFPTNKHEVLYCALEDGKLRSKKRLTDMLGSNKMQPGLTYLWEIPPIGEGFLEWLEEWITAHPATKLVIVDTLAKIKAGKKKDESIYDTDYRQGQGLKHLCEKYHVACFLVHHTRKAISENPLDDISGSYGLSGGMDNMWVIKRNGSTSEGTLYATGRDIDEQNLAIKFDKASLRWLCTGEDKLGTLNEERRKIMVYLFKLGDPAIIADIAKGVERNYEATRTLLKRMHDEGYLIQYGDGKYGPSQMFDNNR